MTVQDVYERASALLFETPGEDTDFRDNALTLINILAAEAFPYENSIRRSKGETELEKPPRFELMIDDIPFSDDICMVALPYGLASFFVQDDNDAYRAHDYRSRYVNALREAAKATEETITDAYGGAE